MLISYDNDAKAMYVSVMDAKVAKTIEFGPETFIDLSKKGELIGVEMLSPNRTDLQRIAKLYHHPELSRLHPEKFLKAVA